MFLRAFGNTPDVMEQEYGPYSDRSRFLAVIDDSDGSALGTIRLIAPDDTSPVKTLTDVAGEPWHLSVPTVLRTAGLSGRPVWDVASLAVDRRYRSGTAGAEITLALCHGLHQYLRNCGVQGLVTILDDRVLRLLRAMGQPWTPMAGATSQYYLGSPASTPCICRVGSVAQSIRTLRPDLAPAILDGSLPSIAVDPTDLLPCRGGALSHVTAPGQSNGQSRAPRGASGWKPPTHRRSRLLVGSPSPDGGHSPTG
ncbi:MAG TPA: hypothetical protein VHF92_07785 [Geodermatophilus sp.]|nr:hypothetical protein [Geodermatophilus sp.]